MGRRNLRGGGGSPRAWSARLCLPPPLLIALCFLLQCHEPQAFSSVLPLCHAALLRGQPTLDWNLYTLWATINLFPSQRWVSNVGSHQWESYLRQTLKGVAVIFSESCYLWQHQLCGNLAVLFSSCSFSSYIQWWLALTWSGTPCCFFFCIDFLYYPYPSLLNVVDIFFLAIGQ